MHVPNLAARAKDHGEEHVAARALFAARWQTDAVMSLECGDGEDEDEHACR